MLIELFAYVADILSYYQDRVANEAYLSTATQRRSVTELLRLIGYQIDPGLAATTHLHLDVTADVVVDGANLPYRLKTAGRPGEADVMFEITRAFALQLRNNAIDLGALAALPAGSTALELARSQHALAEGHAIYLEQTTTLPDATQQIRRSPLLRVVEVRALEDDQDEIRWLPPLPEPFAPATTKLKGNNIPASHGETIADEPIAVSDGTPGQRLTLSRSPVTHLLGQTPTRRRRFHAELEIRVNGTLWEEVESLFASTPADTHYATSIDEDDRLSVLFGDGRRGAVPPAGAEITAVYRIGLGARGNVGADTLSVFLTAVPEIAAISNPFPAEGGADRESTEEAKISGPGSVIAQERAVTLQDYELLAEGFPGIGKAKARVGLRGGYKVVQVFIAPETPRTVPPPATAGELKEALKAHLEASMPVNRMAGVDVLDPVYVPVDITVDVHLKADASRAQVQDAVLTTLRDLLSFARQDFGQPVRVGEVFAVLYPVPGVAYALLKRLARSGAPAAIEGVRVRRRRDRRARAGLRGGAGGQSLRGRAVSIDFAALLYADLPGVYRDKDTAGELRRFLEIAAEPLAELHASVGQLYEDLFIGGCRSELIPLIGGLVGVEVDATLPARAQRAQVADAIRFYRAKGLRSPLERFAQDLTGWPVTLVDFSASVAQAPFVATLNPVLLLRDQPVGEAPSGSGRFFVRADLALQPLFDALTGRPITRAALAGHETEYAGVEGRFTIEERGEDLFDPPAGSPYTALAADLTDFATPLTPGGAALVLGARQVAVDPELGRFLIASPLPQAGNLRVTYSALRPGSIPSQAFDISRPARMSCLGRADDPAPYTADLRAPRRVSDRIGQKHFDNHGFFFSPGRIVANQRPNALPPGERERALQLRQPAAHAGRQPDGRSAPADGRLRWCPAHPCETGGA